MAVFKDAEHCYECIGGLFDIMGQDPGIGKKLANSKILIRFTYTEPDCVISVNCQDPPKKPGFFVEWFRGEAGIKPEVEMTMKADVAHRFWLGKVNLLAALARRQIIAKGPIPKILKLLPTIKPAYALYREFLLKKGLRSMVEEAR